MYVELPRPTIFAHRGASAYAPENTLAAFELAIQQDADAIELDVKLTADDEIVVIHDSTVDRTTDGSGFVSNFTLEALKEFDAGSKFDDIFRGEQIPSLQEVFETLGSKIFINIEITNYQSPRNALPEKTIDLIRFYNLTDSVILSSFNPLALIRSIKLQPNIPLGLLSTPGICGAWSRSFLGRLIPYQALHPEVSDISKHLVSKCHAHGKRVHVYTVNNPTEMHKLFRWNADGVFTDDVPLAKRALLDYQEDFPEDL
jgi:glycerophosphoryl diester phosphodiesterase